MKKFFVSLVVLSLITFGVSAQTSTFNKGDKLLSASIGIGGYYSGTYYSNVSRIPFMAVYYEQCIKDNLFDAKSSIGLGGMLGYTQAKWSDNFKTSTTVIGFRGTFHYTPVDKLDTYAGLMLGYNIVSWKWLNSTYSSLSGNAVSELALGGYIGARYYFSPTFAAFAECGFGAANLNLGVSFKF
jgi:hypothetical protein